MQKRIVKNTMYARIFTGLLTVLICIFLFVRATDRNMRRQADSRAKMLSDIILASDDSPRRVLENLDGDLFGRITFVDSLGEVVYDSDYKARRMENHSDRQEIAIAREEGSAREKRMSETSGKKMYYSAFKTGDKGVVRVGVTVAEAAGEMVKSALPTAFAGIFAVICLVFFVSWLTTGEIVSTIENYDVDGGAGRIYEELSGFVDKIKSRNAIINSQVQTLAGEKLKLQSIFANIKEGILVRDDSGRILQINDEARDMLGIDEKEEKLDGERFPQLRQAVKKACMGGRENCSFSIGDRYFTRSVNNNPTAGIEGAVAVIMDVTRQIESERNRRRYTDNVTHELKTPLTNILGYSQLIADDIAKPRDVKNFAKIIESNAQRLLDTVNDIIKISDLESGYGFRKEEIYLDEVLSDAVGTELVEAAASDVQIFRNLDRVQVLADESRMYRLACNLISNGVRYNIPGGKVWVSLKKEGDFAVIRVRDNGIGIPLRRQDKIFERFYVVDKSRNKNKSSTGLGLAIVKHAVKLHDGFIKVDSRPEKGSVFTVKLPVGL